jgi:Flp pilus assembly protein TadD
MVGPTATLCRKNGDVETAICSFEKALGEDPRHAIALANAGMCYIATGRYEDAVAPLRRGLALAQDERYAAEVRGRLRWLNSVMGRDSP